jgi:biopolymer transport protein TolR
MKLRRPAAKQSGETIIALIDVVFFLLVFFMLIGRMDATSPFDLVPPTAFTGTDMPAGGITVSISAAGDLALDGLASDRTSLIFDIATRLSNEPALMVRVNADKSAELRHVLPLVGEIEAIGAREVVLVVTPNAP